MWFDIKVQCALEYSSSKRLNFTICVCQPYNKVGDGPESPEVAIITDQLNEYLSGKMLTQFIVVGGRYFDQFIGLPVTNSKTIGKLHQFIASLPNRIASVKCKGKFIYITFETGNWTIWNTLGMSGKWVFNQETHSHIELTLDNNDNWSRFIKVSNKPS